MIIEFQPLIFRYLGNGRAEAISGDRLYSLEVLNTGQCRASVQGVPLGAGPIPECFDICQEHMEKMALDGMKTGSPLAA